MRILEEEHRQRVPPTMDMMASEQTLHALLRRPLQVLRRRIDPCRRDFCAPVAAAGAAVGGAPRAHARADDPGAGGTAAAVGWPGFVRGVARCCKGRAARRAPPGCTRRRPAGLGADGARALLRDSLAAARAGGAARGGRGVRRAGRRRARRCGRRAAGVAADDFAAWGGRAAAGAASLDAHLLALLRATGGAADAAAAAAAAPAAAMSAVHEPLLEGAAGQEDSRSALCSAARARGRSPSRSATPPPARRAWRCLYASAAHGLSLNRFVHHTAGTRGAIVLVVATDRGELLGAHIDAPLKPSDACLRRRSGRLPIWISLAPNFHVYRPTGSRRTSRSSTRRSPARFAARTTTARRRRRRRRSPLGGQNSRFRLALEDDLNTRRHHASLHHLPRARRRRRRGGGGRRRRGRAPRVVGVELWGCGGVESPRRSGACASATRATSGGRATSTRS